MTLRLLVAEDSKTMQRVLEIALSPHDVALMMVLTRKDAVAALSRHAFDAAIIDADLPDTEGGYALARELCEASVERLPVILLTSEQHGFDAARAQMAGVNQSVHKPFTTQALTDALQAVAGPHSDAVAPAASAEEPEAAVHMAAIDEALAALGRDVSSTPEGQAPVRPPAFIRLEGDAPGAPLPARHKPKPFFEEETTNSRAFVGTAAPVTIVRRPSDALREQSRSADALPSVEALPALPSWDAASPREAQLPPPPPSDRPNASHTSSGQSATAESGAASPAQELVALFSSGPHSADTPRLNALLAETLEKQLTQILWQVVPNVVAEEVRRYVQQAVPAQSPPPPPSGPSHPGH